MTAAELSAVVTAHGAWLRGDPSGARADLTGAYLAGANLARADLTGAYLARADLARADLTGANLARAKRIVSVGPVDGWIMYAVYWDDGPRILAGCRWFPLAEARTHWGEGCADRREHGDRMLAGVDALVSLGRALGYPGREAECATCGDADADDAAREVKA